MSEFVAENSVCFTPLAMSICEDLPKGSINPDRLEGLAFEVQSYFVINRVASDDAALAMNVSEAGKLTDVANAQQYLAEYILTLAHPILTQEIDYVSGNSTVFDIVFS